MIQHINKKIAASASDSTTQSDCPLLSTVCNDTDLEEALKLRLAPFASLNFENLQVEVRSLVSSCIAEPSISP